MKRIIVTVSVLVVWCFSGVAFSQDQDAEMANVQSIMQQSHAIQQQRQEGVQDQQAAQKAGANLMQSLSGDATAKQQLVTPDSAAVQAPIMAPAVVTPGANPTVKELESELSELNQANVVFQQQTDQRIDILNQQDAVLTAKLANIGQILSVLTQEITQLGDQVKSAQQQLVVVGGDGKTLPLKSNTGTISDFTQQPATNKAIQYLLYVVVVLLLVLIFMLMPRRRGDKVVAENFVPKTRASIDVQDTNDTKDEYDFMGSKEAIPAKLALARAYLAMEDYKSAKKVLTQVVKVGDKDQKKEAQGMLDQISTK